MQNKIVGMATVVMLFLCVVCAGAQTAVVCAGGDGDNLSFSIGQTVVGNATTDQVNVEIGIQQPYELLVTGLDDPTNGFSVKVRVYPNPTTSFLQVETEEVGKLNWRLYSANGQLASEQTTDGGKTSIDMSLLPCGNYILKLRMDNNREASFQIIKKRE